MSSISKVDKEILKTLAELSRAITWFFLGITWLTFFWYTLSFTLLTGGKIPLWLGALGYLGLVAMFVAIRIIIDIRVKTSFKSPETGESEIKSLRLLKQAYEEGMIDAIEYERRKGEILDKLTKEI